jgi:arylsulfatase A-like enzyme
MSIAVARAVRLAAAVATAALATACSSGCGRSHDGTGGNGSGDSPRAASAGSASAGASADSNGASGAAAGDDDGQVYPLLEHLDTCVMGHDGVLLDAGDPSMRRHYGDRIAAPLVDDVERDGATWARLRDRTLTLSFYGFPEDSAPSDPPLTSVDVRFRAPFARSVTATLNGRTIGTASLGRGPNGGSQVASLHAPFAALVDGSNEVTLRFATPKGVSAPAEVDWVHVGAGSSDQTYAAPTRGDAVTTSTVGGENHAALSLRAPGFVRCAAALPASGRVQMLLALAGGDDAEVVIRERRDRAPMAELASIHLQASDTTRWQTVDLPLPAEGQPRLAFLEVAVTQASKGTRVLVGEPKVVGSGGATVAPAPNLRGVVLLVDGDLTPKRMVPYGAVSGGGAAMPELAALAHDGATFYAHRASSSYPASAMASMLSGLPAFRARLNDADAALPADVVTLADAARQAGVVSAFFTENPTTGAAFGFGRGWGTFSAASPLDDGPPTRIFDLAAKWIEAHKSERFLLVLHARGGHPPWPTSPDVLKLLPPAAYAGALEPAQAADLLTHARKSPSTLHFGDPDRIRAFALYDQATAAHDAGLGRLVAALKTAGRSGDTALVVTSDIGVDEAAKVPFGDGDGLEEAALDIPLVLSVPASSFVQKVQVPTSSEDVARTVLDLLGLAPPSSFGGRSLLQALRPRAEPAGRFQLATLGDKFSLRWRDFVLDGSGTRETKLCDLSLEPSCSTDVRASYGITTEILREAAIDIFVGDHPGVPTGPRVAAALDATTLAALKAWGR